MPMNSKETRGAISILFAFGFLALLGPRPMALAQPDPAWKIHDMARPAPVRVHPGAASTAELVGKPPSDAVVLFDGQDLSLWCGMEGQAPGWIVKEGQFQVNPGSGDIRSWRSFGNCQLHVEWQVPEESGGDGNSGVLLMGMYEIQVFESDRHTVYPDGQAGALYGQYPPEINACRSPGEWQTYDIIFHAPAFSPEGVLLRTADVTVLHNGVVIQDRVVLTGPTRWLTRPSYESHPEKLPLVLQDHGTPVRYRNIWLRELPGGVGHEGQISLPPALLDQYLGKYLFGSHFGVTLFKKGFRTMARIGSLPAFEVFPQSRSRFFAESVDVQFDFEIGSDGRIVGLVMQDGGEKRRAKKQ